MRADRGLIADLQNAVWGDQYVPQDVFQRWSQGLSDSSHSSHQIFNEYTSISTLNELGDSGFVFSADEPTALLQSHGGQCGVLAPVQV